VPARERRENRDAADRERGFTIMKWSSALSAGLVVATSLAHGQSVYPTGTTIWDKTATQDGFTIFCGADGVCRMIDMDGTVVNTWTSPIPGFDLNYIDPIAPGHITAFLKPAGAAGPSLTIAELDYGDALVWFYNLPKGAPPGSTFHHDSERLQNGNTIIIGSQPIVAPWISPLPIQDDLLIEVDPAGKLVWSWFLREHVGEFGFDDEAKALIAKQGGDWAHMNSVYVIPPNHHTDPALAEGNLIVSLRYTNTIFIIEKATGSIVWKIGPGDHITFGQHAPHMIPPGLPGAGNLLVFDNGSGTGYPLRKRAPGYSRIQEIDPETKKPVWIYDASQSGQNIRDFWSDVTGNAQRLANGNTLIDMGGRGRLFEVDANGRIVWEYMSPYTDANGLRVVFRAYRVDYSWNK
jgi:outer membrane protein assembly factor BamB